MRAGPLTILCMLFTTNATFAAEPMVPRDIQATFFNGQPFTASTPSGSKFKMVFISDGQMTRESLTQSGTKTSGKWKLSASGFCTTWQHAKPNCFTVVSSGENKWSVRKIATTIEMTVAIWSR